MPGWRKNPFPGPWLKLYDLYMKYELAETNGPYCYNKVRTNNVEILVEAGVLGRKSKNSKLYRVKDHEVWALICEGILKR